MSREPMTKLERDAAKLRQRRMRERRESGGVSVQVGIIDPKKFLNQLAAQGLLEKADVNPLRRGVKLVLDLFADGLLLPPNHVMAHRHNLVLSGPSTRPDSLRNPSVVLGFEL